MATVFCWMLIAGTAGAANYCVDSAKGSDSNSCLCSASKPWRTISKMVSEEGTFKPGDTIQFLGGDVWRGEELTLNNVHGTSGSPITFTSYGTGYGTGQPVMDGCPQ